MLRSCDELDQLVLVIATANSFKPGDRLGVDQGLAALPFRERRQLALTLQDVHQPPHQGQLQLLGQNLVEPRGAGVQFLAHETDFFGSHALAGPLNSGVQHEGVLQSLLDALDGGVCDLHVGTLLGLHDRDVRR